MVDSLIFVRAILSEACTTLLTHIELYFHFVFNKDRLKVTKQTWRLRQASDDMACYMCIWAHQSHELEKQNEQMRAQVILGESGISFAMENVFDTDRKRIKYLLVEDKYTHTHITFHDTRKKKQ